MNMGKRKQARPHKDTDRIKFMRSELPGLAEQLEAMYNALASRGIEPSEKVQRLILWVKQEAEVLDSPD